MHVVLLQLIGWDDTEAVQHSNYNAGDSVQFYISHRMMILWKQYTVLVDQQFSPIFTLREKVNIKYRSIWFRFGLVLSAHYMVWFCFARLLHYLTLFGFARPLYDLFWFRSHITWFNLISLTHYMILFGLSKPNQTEKNQTIRDFGLVWFVYISGPL